MKCALKPLTYFCLLLALFLSLWLKPVQASLSLSDPRINRLESQLRSLQSQVNRLQSQLPRAGNSRPAPIDRPPAPETPSFDQQFDTLAVLVIELQQRVSVLETKLEEMEESTQ
ncbi:hypothetical protein Lepto7375DRAFT_4482 [Leptolyngbya sp. PCC 7375]|nr:hypothetical protein Lepto7375DRAFT_4482 [Leptolyngbya sp. PCC 7375]